MSKLLQNINFGEVEMTALPTSPARNPMDVQAAITVLYAIKIILKCKKIVAKKERFNLKKWRIHLCR